MAAAHPLRDLPIPPLPHGARENPVVHPMLDRPRPGIVEFGANRTGHLERSWRVDGIVNREIRFKIENARWPVPHRSTVVIRISVGDRWRSPVPSDAGAAMRIHHSEMIKGRIGMRYEISQKLLRLGEDSEIFDENGDLVYRVDGKVFSLRNLLVIRDRDWNEVARVERKILALTPTYEITIHGRPAGEVRKQILTLFRDRFTIDIPGPQDLEMSGDILKHEFAIRQGDQNVAIVSKRWIALTDTYGVDIAPGHDELFLLTCVLALDLALDQHAASQRNEMAH
jgi:uncharacterized protein YxjI